MKITKIHIENVRGIEDKSFDVTIYPNKPSILVAPNGYGKSSFAIAFNSLMRDRLEVTEENKFANRGDSISKLTVTTDDGTDYVADNNSNSITNTFSVFVINGQLYSKHTCKSFGGRNIVKSAICVAPIILIKTIPNKCEFSYAYNELKTEFGNSSKLLINLSDDLKKFYFVNIIEMHADDFVKLNQVRNTAKSDRFLSSVDQLTGSKQRMILAQNQINFTEIETIPAMANLYQRFHEYWNEKSKVEIYINIIQLSKIYRNNGTELSNILKYYAYLMEEAEIDEMLTFFNCTWKNIRTKKKSGQLILEFPQATQISNGERDVLCFIGKLFEAKLKMRKERCILIIDEIFDYLDDANLISAQYFLSKFMNEYKECEKELYLIILTHLDPMYFQTYCFSTRNVQYLVKASQTTNLYNINNILKNRKQCKSSSQLVYENISSYYLHYNNQEVESQETRDYLTGINADPTILIPSGFKAVAFNQLEKYKRNEEYDIAFVCCGIRIIVEQSACEQLTPVQQIEFIDKNNNTVEKLHYAKQCGANVPEVHFLLSIIYNEAMHLDDQCKKLNPISYKLKNKVIRNMICEI